MSESRNHIKQYTASDIQKYLDGKMSASEMYALEKASLEDPFLADAIEGMDQVQSSFGNQTIDNDTSQLREWLDKRVKDNDKVVPIGRFNWGRVAIAAAVVLILGAVTYNNFIKREEATTPIAVNTDETSQKADAPPASSNTESKKDTSPAGMLTVPEFKAEDIKPQPLTIDEKKKPPFPEVRHDYTTDDTDKHAKEIRPAAPSRQEDASRANPPSVKSEETVVVDRNIASQRKQSPQRDSVVIISADEEKPLSILTPVSSDKKPAGKTANDDLAAANDPRKKSKGKDAGVTNNNALNFFNGRVTDANNQPIANASVLLVNQNAGAKGNSKPYKSGYVTDQYGYFLVPSADSSIKVTVAGVGYTTQTVQLRNDVAINQVQLAPSNESLSEVVITSKKDNRERSNYKSKYPSVLVQDAEPANGWIEFDKYINQNKKQINDNGTTSGEVVVSFLVNRKSELSSFKVEQSLSTQHDAEALRLVKEGPAWKLLKGKKARIVVIVKF